MGMVRLRSARGIRGASVTETKLCQQEFQLNHV